MSWGSPEFQGEALNDGHFSKTGVTFVAASGNAGAGGFYPAASPNVVGVGATRLSFDASGGYAGESAWGGSSGGLSQFEPEPVFQSLFQIPNNTNQRGIPDVAYSGDPTAGFAVYSSHPVMGTKGWFQLGGTSAAAPQWAALFAIVNSMRKSPLSGDPGVLYQVASPATFHDITSGSNGDCGPPVCTAAPGYDYVTGLGSPIANQLIPALVNK
jgi:subtilase family serine protease